MLMAQYKVLTLSKKEKKNQYNVLTTATFRLWVQVTSPIKKEKKKKLPFFQRIMAHPMGEELKILILLNLVLINTNL